MSIFKNNKPEKTKEIALVTPKETSLVTQGDVDKWLRTFGVTKDLLPNEVEAFTTMATMMNLNPFKKEIHVVAYGSKTDPSKRTLAIMTGYEVYIERAEDTGLLENWYMEEAGPEVPIEKYWARVVVKRKDRPTVQSWTVDYSEAVQKNSFGKPNANWKKQPKFMTKKTAISQGFRLYFKGALSGLPNTVDEMPDNTEINVTPNPQPVEKAVHTFENNAAPESSVMDAEPAEGQTMPESHKVAPVEQETPTIDYFAEIMRLVSSSKTLEGIRKMEIVRNAKEANGDAVLLKNLFEDVVRENG